jgi:hypothetical protein
MKKVWLTYAWKDNEDKDIDFIIQELDKTDLDVKFDRRNLIPGQRLWTQISGTITDSNECDAWGIVLTPNSIRSEPCIEELSYALDIALSDKGAEFPIFALLHNVSPSEMPLALKIRLCIPIENNNWTEQVVAAATKVPTGFIPSNLNDFILKEHSIQNDFYMEIRPRFNRISPFMIAVDYEEKESGNVTDFEVGPANQIPSGVPMYMVREGESTLLDGTHVWVYQANNEANSTTSYFLFYKNCPKRIWFGHPQNLNLATF